MNRLKSILVAGTLTGLVLATLLALGLRDANRTTTAAEAAPVVATEVQTNAPIPADSAAEVQALQTYNARLEAALQTMQAREAQYQMQLESANQTILQLQNQLDLAQSIQTQSAPRGEHDGFEGHDD